MALENFRTRFGKAMMELLASAIIVLVFQLGTPSSATYYLAFGLAFAAAVYIAEPVSGAYINPSISLAAFINGKLSLHQMSVYCTFQVIGAILAALLGGIIGGHFTPVEIGKGFHLVQAFLAEFTFTTILCLVHLGVLANSKTRGNSFYGLAIGSAAFAGMLAVASISGAYLNPALAIGLAITKGLWKTNLIYLGWIILAELLGGVAGPALFYIVAPDEFTHFSDEAHGLLDEARTLLPTRS